jgi:drug/metabolite transporter (DMT)-like permease
MGKPTLAVLVTVAFSVVGVVLFEESMNHYELAGIVPAVASLILLMRFA